MGHASLRKLAVVLAPALFAIFGVATIARDVQHPYRDEHERIYRDAARWFWSEQNKQPGQLVAIDTDLGLDFFPGDSAEMGWLAYRVNQRIYSNWHHRGAAWIDQGRVRTERPLRCVMHHQAGIARDEARYHQWLAEMKTRFDLKSEKVYRWGEVVPRAAEVYEVLEFVPKDPTPNRGRRERGFSLFKGRSAMHSMASDTINGQSPSRL